MNRKFGKIVNENRNSIRVVIENPVVKSRQRKRRRKAVIKKLPTSLPASFQSDTQKNTASTSNLYMLYLRNQNINAIHRQHNDTVRAQLVKEHSNNANLLEFQRQAGLQNQLLLQQNNAQNQVNMQQMLGGINRNAGFNHQVITDRVMDSLRPAVQEVYQRLDRHQNMLNPQPYMSDLDSLADTDLDPENTDVDLENTDLDTDLLSKGDDTDVGFQADDDEELSGGFKSADPDLRINPRTGTNVVHSGSTPSTSTSTRKPKPSDPRASLWNTFQVFNPDSGRMAKYNNELLKKMTDKGYDYDEEIKEFVPRDGVVTKKQRDATKKAEKDARAAKRGKQPADPFVTPSNRVMRNDKSRTRRRKNRVFASENDEEQPEPVPTWNRSEPIQNPNFKGDVNMSDHIPRRTKKSSN
jgi:hypothetical protein